MRLKGFAAKKYEIIPLTQMKFRGRWDTINSLNALVRDGQDAPIRGLPSETQKF